MKTSLQIMNAILFLVLGVAILALSVHMLHTPPYDWPSSLIEEIEKEKTYGNPQCDGVTECLGQINRRV